MATVEIDRDGDRFVAIWVTIHGPQRRRFDTRLELDAFALKKMGKTGCIIDKCDMSAAQRAEDEARTERARQVMAGGA